MSSKSRIKALAGEKKEKKEKNCIMG